MPSVLPFEKLALTELSERKILQGQIVETGASDGLYKLYQNGGETFYGIAEVKDGKAKAKTKLC